MSTGSSHILNYGQRKARRIWRKAIYALLVLGSVGLAMWYGHPIGHKLKFLWWQRECLAYSPDPHIPLWEGDPPRAKAIVQSNHDYVDLSAIVNGCPAKAELDPLCWRNVENELSGGSSLYDMVVFLHELKSPHGTKRLVCLTFSPNGHAQFCTIICTVVRPASLFHTAKIEGTSNLWVPGWWEWGVRKSKLRFATIDPLDASHIIFRYENNVAPTTGEWATDKGSDVYYVTHYMDNKTCTIDGWLRDNGDFDLELRDGASYFADESSYKATVHPGHGGEER